MDTESLKRGKGFQHKLNTPIHAAAIALKRRSMMLLPTGSSSKEFSNTENPELAVGATSLSSHRATPIFPFLSQSVLKQQRKEARAFVSSKENLRHLHKSKLHFAVERQYVELVNYIIAKQKRDQGTTFPVDSKRQTALHVAIASSSPRKDIVHPLIAASTSAVFLTRDDQGFYPLNYAYLNGSPWLLKSVAEAYPHAILERLYNGENILEWAIRDGKQDVIKLLLQSGGEWILGLHAVRTGRRVIPLVHHFASTGNMQLLQMIVDLGANINLIDHYGKTAIFYAVENLSLDLLKWLVSNGALLNVKDPKGNGLLLTVAGIDGAASLIEYLITQDQRPLNLTNLSGWNVLHASAGITSNLSILLPICPEVNPRSGSEGVTPLHLAVDAGNVDTVRLLLDAGADLEALDTKPLTTLQRVIDRILSKRLAQIQDAVARCLDMVQLLLDAGANIYAKNREGLELILKLISSGIGIYMPLFVSFLDRYQKDRRQPELDTPNLDNRLLQIALGKEETKTLEFLLNNGLKLDGETVVRFAETAQLYSPFEKLKLAQTHGAIIREPRRQECLALHALIREYTYGIWNLRSINAKVTVHTLLQFGINPNQVCPADGLTPLQKVIEEAQLNAALRISDGLCDIAIWLLKHGVNLKQNIKMVKSKNGAQEVIGPRRTIFGTALLVGHYDLVNSCLDFGAAIKYETSMNKDFANLIMCHSWSLSMWRRFLDLGIDPSSMFIPSESKAAMMTFEWNEVSHKMTKDQKPISFLSYMAFFGEEEIIRLLLDYGASPEKTDHFGRTALHFFLYGRKLARRRLRELSKENATSLVKLLLGNRVNPSQTDSFLGLAPIHLMVEWGNEKVCIEAFKMMFYHCKDINVRNSDGLRAIDMAEESYQRQLVGFLKGTL